MRKGLVLVLVVWISTVVGGAVRADDSDAGDRRPRLEIWREILGARVNDRGEVAYRTLAAFDHPRLETFLDSLAHVDLGSLDGTESVALWINAYNAGVVWGVLHGGRPETVTGRARLYAWLEIDVGGKRRTLDAIQGELARYAALDPRIHLALCNGARGGPALSREPYEEDDLDEQLDRAARAFVRDPERNRLTGENEALSPIFTGHRADFTKESGWIGAWLAPYLEDPEREHWMNAETKTPAFLDFDWRLNAARDEDPAKESPAPASTAKR